MDSRPSSPDATLVTGGPRPDAQRSDARRSDALRSDALRNRDRLLASARVAFAADARPSLEAIARDAGVGIGTLYRHFPTREALVEAVYQAELGRLCDEAAILLATDPADVALRHWMDRFADYVAAKRDIADALRAADHSAHQSASSARSRLAEAVRPVLDAGVAAGTLRAGIDGGDVVASLVGIFLAAGDPGQAGRMLDLLMDGLRVRR